MNGCNFTSQSIHYTFWIVCRIQCKDISIQFASNFPLIQLISTLEPWVKSYDFHLSIHAKIIALGVCDANLQLNLVEMIIFELTICKTLYTGVATYIRSTVISIMIRNVISNFVPLENISQKQSNQHVTTFTVVSDFEVIRNEILVDNAWY